MYFGCHSTILHGDCKKYEFFPDEVAGDDEDSPEMESQQGIDLIGMTCIDTRSAQPFEWWPVPLSNYLVMRFLIEHFPVRYGEPGDL